MTNVEPTRESEWEQSLLSALLKMPETVDKKKVMRLVHFFFVLKEKVNKPTKEVEIKTEVSAFDTQTAKLSNDW